MSLFKLLFSVIRGALWLPLFVVFCLLAFLHTLLEVTLTAEWWDVMLEIRMED
jgi:hypothetical protein